MLSITTIFPQDRLQNVGSQLIIIMIIIIIIIIPQDRLENVGNQFAFTTILSFLISVPVMLIKVPTRSN